MSIHQALPCGYVEARIQTLLPIGCVCRTILYDSASTDSKGCFAVWEMQQQSTTDFFTTPNCSSPVRINSRTVAQLTAEVNFTMESGTLTIQTIPVPHAPHAPQRISTRSDTHWCFTSNVRTLVSGAMGLSRTHSAPTRTSRTFGAFSKLFTNLGENMTIFFLNFQPTTEAGCGGVTRSFLPGRPKIVSRLPLLFNASKSWIESQSVSNSHVENFVFHWLLDSDLRFSGMEALTAASVFDSRQVRKMAPKRNYIPDTNMHSAYEGRK